MHINQFYVKMNKYFQTVFEVLKNNKEVKQLGFSRKEVKGIAEKIANKINLKDEASEDEINDAVDEAIEDALPFFVIMQSAIDRRVQSLKNTLKDDNDDGDGNQKPEPKPEPKPNPKSKDLSDGNKTEVDELKDLLLSNFDKLSKRMDIFEKQKTTDTRLEKVKKMVEGTGKFGERQIKAFKRMNFETEEEFEEYTDDLQSEIDEVNSERANFGLDKMGKIPPTGKPKKDDELMSDEDIKSLAQF